MSDGAAVAASEVPFVPVTMGPVWTAFAGIPAGLRRVPVSREVRQKYEGLRAAEGRLEVLVRFPIDRRATVWAVTLSGAQEPARGSTTDVYVPKVGEIDEDIAGALEWLLDRPLQTLAAGADPVPEVCLKAGNAGSYMEREFVFDCHVGANPDEIGAACSVLGRPAGAKVVELRIRRHRVAFLCQIVAPHASGGTFRVRGSDVGIGKEITQEALEVLWAKLHEELGAVVKRAQAIAGMG